MKRIFKLIPILFILTMFACSIEKNPNLKEEPPIIGITSYFYPKYHKPITIFSAFKLIGVKSISENEKAHREYNIWKDSKTNKYILITVIRPYGRSFPDNVQWIDRESAIYSNENKTAYDFLHERPTSVINDFDLDGTPLPDCIIVAQEFYYHPQEVIYKVLIVPDKMCAKDVEPVIKELDRVAILQ